jgi:hypothetical protein
MFNFFFKRPTLVLDCFTYVPELETLFPIVPAEERLPPFWKKLSPTVNHFGINRGTVRTCPGIGTLFKTGFILQNWHDYAISTEDNNFRWHPENMAEQHNSKQWGEYLKSYHHLKLISPWRIKEKTGVNFLFTNCFWHDDEFKPTVVNGIVDYKYQYTTSVNMLVPKTMFPKTLTIPAGKELAHVIPLSESDVKIKMHTVSSIEYDRLNTYTFSFQGAYFKRKKILKDKGL